MLKEHIEFLRSTSSSSCSSNNHSDGNNNNNSNNIDTANNSINLADLIIPEI